MVRSAEELIGCVEHAARSFGLKPGARVIARKGEYGAEHLIEHIKVRNGSFGPELIVQIAEQPNAG